MRSHLLVAVLAMGCGETQLGPFQPLPIDVRLDVQGNDSLIHIARDRFGIAHVYATSYRDLGFAQGYVMAHDRLAQMEMLRRFASGTLAELYGVTDPTVIEIDKEMRFHRLRLYAEQTYVEIEKRQTLRDEQLTDVLEQFAAGVNAYVGDVQRGRWPLDPAIRDAGLAPLFAPQQFTEWTPIDSVAIMRLYTLAQSWTVPEELDLTALDVKVSRTFSPALARDLLAFAPIGNTTPTPPGVATAATRPPVSDALLASARAFFTRAPANPTQPLSPHAFMRPFLGSTAIAVGADFTLEQLETPKAILAADMQVAPMNPGLFYPLHQIIAGALQDDPHVHDVMGLMIPGVPVAIAGTNGDLGWAPTVGTHDVNDIYYEQLVTMNGQLHSMHDGVAEPLETFTEEIQIGNFGDISTSELVTYERVPRHGTIIPGHPAGEALSVEYTGHKPSDEIAILWELGDAARDVETANLVLGGLTHGSHYMVIDARGAYAWSSFAEVPTRQATARSWSPASPDAAAPFFVLDGRNPAHEWIDSIPRPELPFVSAREPAIVVADADPIGATADGDPLNQPYFGVAYVNGLREDRIRALLGAATLPISGKKLADILHDTRSTFGERIKDEVARILDEAIPALPPAQQQQAMLAYDVLAQWTLDTPAGGVAADAASSATLFFNTWVHYFLTAVIGDELTAAGYPAALDDDRAARIVYRLLIAPDSLVQNPATSAPLLCGTTGCKALVVQAAAAALADLTADGSGRDDWRWGRRHPLVLRPLFPDAGGVLTLPNTQENPAPFQLAGDMFAVARADGGWADTDFTPRLTVAYGLALIGSAIGAPLAMRLELPTGAVIDTRDPHYRDLLETSYLSQTAFDVPIEIDDINDNGESRWELR